MTSQKWLIASLAAVIGCSAPPRAAPAPAPAAPASAVAQQAAPTGETLPAAVRDVIDAADRNPQDRELDAGRHPGEMLAFYGIAGGMRVAELMAGGGYTAELLARTVGPEGKVYGQNNAFMLERFAQAPWTERLTKEVNKNIVRLDRELESPLPEDARDLDAVFLVLFYHDSVWMKTDRAKMNAAIFAALKSGGVYAVIDHSASDGAGVEHAKTLHRIEEKVVREEVAAAGFKLAGEASFLRNPADPRDWSASPSTAGERRGTSDRFVLKFVKP